MVARAQDLAERYAVEADAPAVLLEDLRALAAEADVGMDLAAVAAVRVVPGAT